MDNSDAPIASDWLPGMALWQKWNCSTKKSLFGPMNAKKRTKYLHFADFSTLSNIIGPIMDNIDAPIDSDWLLDILHEICIVPQGLVAVCCSFFLLS